MAIEPIYKMTLFVHQKDGETVLEALQRAGVVHPAPALLERKRPADSPLRQVDSSVLVEELNKEDTRLEQLQFLLQHLQPLVRSQSGNEALQARDLSLKPEASVESLYREVHSILQKEHRLHHEMEVLSRRWETLGWLEGLQFPLEELATFRRVGVIFFAVPSYDSEKLLPQLRGWLKENGVLLTLPRPDQRILVVVIVRRNLLESLQQWLEQREITPLDLSWCQGKASHCRKEIELQLEVLEIQIEHLREQQRRYAREWLPSLLDLYQDALNRRERLKHLLLGRGTTHLWAFSGWVPARKKKKLQQVLSQTGLPYHLIEQNPEPEDEPPVAYLNPPPAEPFEFVTDLYSRPRYWEIDPTPLMAPFFALFFGICLTDGGYGLLLGLVSWWFLRRRRTLSEGAGKLLRLLAISGGVTMVVGTLTGGFFGFPAQQLPAPLNALSGLVILNPARDQLTFLYFVLGLGMVHVGVGIGIAFARLWRQGKRSDALLDQGPWLGILLAVSLLIFASALGGILILNWMGMLLLAGSLLVLLLFAGRRSANPFARLAQGAFAVYRISNLLGDVLSYARLFALGMATGVIAGVVNIIARMALRAGWLGYVLVAAILIVGHALNLAINALGGFIHTARLQYVEFFGKFFEGGGEPFRPLRIQTLSDWHKSIREERS